MYSLQQILVSHIKKSDNVSKVTGREMVEPGLNPGPSDSKTKALDHWTELPAK